MHTLTRFALILVAVAMVVIGGCRRNEGRPFTRHTNRPTYSTPFSVASPTPVSQPTTTGRILSVPSQYPTIKEAVLHALPNDVVELAPGTHSVEDTIEWSGFTIRGSGAERTEVTWDGQNGVVFSPQDFTSVQNLTITRGSSKGWYIGIRCWNAHNVTVSGVNIKYISTGLDLWYSHDILITDVMTGGCYNVINLNNCTNVVLRRNSFVRGEDILTVSQSNDVTVEENIFSLFWGTALQYDAASEPTLRSIRNNVWSNTSKHYYWNSSTNNSSTLSRGSDLTDNPIMVDPDLGDFRLSPLSPCITAGTGGGRIGSWRHPQAPAYKTDLQMTIDPISPSGTLPIQFSSSNVLIVALIADSRGPVIFDRWIGGFEVEVMTSSGNPISQNGVISIVDLDTGVTIADSYAAYYHSNIYRIWMHQPFEIPAGTVKRLAIQVESNMIPTGTPFQATLHAAYWSDGRIQRINDRRISPIVGNVVQF